MGWSGLLLFPTAYLAIGGLLVLRLLRHGTPTDWRLPTLKVLIFLQQQCRLLLMLWVILFFYFGVLSLRAISSAGSNLGGLWAFVALHGAFALIGFMLRQFELARLIGIRPYNAIAFSGPIAVFVSVFLIYPLGQSSLVLCAVVWRCGDLQVPPFPTRISQLDAQPLPHDGCCRYPWWSIAFCHPWCYSREHFVSRW